MKTNFLSKAKWYVVGFILVAIMLSVSLSFSAWDTLNAKAKLESSGSGDYFDYIKINDYINLVEDRYSADNVLGSNKRVDVGDIVTFGNYYQKSGATTTTAQRWIVVEKDGNKLTLLAHQVIANGNFWGNNQYYQNYYQSTVRSWLNSGKGSLQGSGTEWKDNERYNDNTRNDNIGSKFDKDESNKINKGFLDVAFPVGSPERKLLVPKLISGMQGRGINNNPSSIDPYKTSDGRSNINDLVWLPSWQEVYGTTENPWSGMSLYDGTPNTKFSYFNDAVGSGTSPKRNWTSAKLATTWTGYATGANSSYYNDGAGGNTSWWWLRSPHPLNYSTALIVDSGGHGSTALTYSPDGGVRPAVCVQL